jgi:DNA-binding NarL/FixJ family response regulator
MKTPTLADFPRTEREIALTVTSPTEQEVWRLIALGFTTREIAARPGMKKSVKTVETQRDSLQKKLGVRGAATLTRLAIRYGLIQVEVLPS